MHRDRPLLELALVQVSGGWQARTQAWVALAALPSLLLAEVLVLVLAYSQPPGWHSY